MDLNAPSMDTTSGPERIRAGPLDRPGAKPAATDVVPGTDVLEARDVVVRFGGLVALQNVNMAIRRKEIFGLIGPNGAGKSTTVNVLTGFQQPTSGSVLINGNDIQGWRPHLVARYGVARTFQAARIFSALSVLDNVAVAALSGGGDVRAARARALEILDWIGCAEHAGLPGNALSYGDQRRIGIARALALAPSFVLLDEPAAGMNEQECEALITLVSSMPHRWGCGVLLIEHNMSVVMRTCSRILVLDGGRPIAEGTPSAIQANADVRRAYLGERKAGA
jgi:branched-chain amino acid transport system ATP-binding protein